MIGWFLRNRLSNSVFHEPSWKCRSLSAHATSVEVTA